MPHPFTVDRSVEVEASPDVVWEALSTGPGIDGWYIGAPNEVEPGLGGVMRLDYGGVAGESVITAWDPPHRLVHGGTPDPDGVVHTMEYTLEGRAGGTTTVRLVHSGFLGDDWEAEYEALGEGDPMYLHLLAQYVRFFRGRPARVISHFRPDVPGRSTAMALLRAALGVSGDAAVGERVLLAPAGLPAEEGTLDFTSPSILGVRTDDALYRFLYSPMGGGIYMGHHIYRQDVDPAAATAAWAAWLDAGVSASRRAATA